ncbi:MAG TPA: radical SAM protein [Firmicutes bacterium]|jgi:wyosine [tRNA(Phe)-imidazoG37] synthetase (radical SAM superfamily)|nr:radical SAM protein [Bacillota bacterium]
MYDQSGNRKHLFGPVPSRRLGNSLGIDLVPYKTCSLDCVYCECGRTTDLTIDQKEYAPTEEVIKELDSFLRENPLLDYVTFSGSGEPLLHSGIGEIIGWLKENYPAYPVAVLTNGTLLTQQETRKQVGLADLVIPSLDAISEDVFRRINRPHPSLDNEEIISGLEQFRREYQGEIRLEVFVIPGLNNTEGELALLGEAIRRIQPNLLQLNSLDRPGTEGWVGPASVDELARCARILGEGEPIPGCLPNRGIPTPEKDPRSSIIPLLRRRPCTMEDLQHALGFHPLELGKYLHQLVQENCVKAVREKRGIFYKMQDPS